MLTKHLSVCGALLATLVLASTAAAKPPDGVNSSKLRAAVTVDGIVEHQRALQNIATMNGGTRHTETPGYLASVAYVPRAHGGGRPGTSRSRSSTCRTGGRPRRRSSSS